MTDRRKSKNTLAQKGIKMSQEIFFLKMEWLMRLMNASFFPEQLKHCMRGLLGSEGRAGLSFVLLLNPRRLSLVNLNPHTSEKIGAGDASLKWTIWIVCVCAPFWKWGETASDWEETDWAGMVKTLETAFAWHSVIYYLNTHLSKAEWSQLLLWHGMQSDGWVYPKGWLITGLPHQVARIRVRRELGACLPGACLCQMLPAVLFSLKFLVCKKGLA